MACKSCSSCKTGGCGQLSVFDWLENFVPPGTQEANNIYEVKFKSTRKGFFQNINSLPIITGDFVTVESDRGFDVGMITMGGELARLQMKKKKVDEKTIQKIFRIATEEDLSKLENFRVKEPEALIKSRAIIATLKLDMKLSEIEYQADGTKAIFYYTAEQRVDFRELIRVLANEFKIRIEMRQIGLRQESGLVGGIGSCGRELCCSTWLTDFKSVTTMAARYQNISLNPSKITGMCGRLKCCLNYELETYLDALKDIPDVKEIHTELGTALLQKTDIFLRKMWFSYGGDSNWIVFDIEQVIEINKQNRRGIKIPSLAAIEDRKASTIKSLSSKEILKQRVQNAESLPPTKFKEDANKHNKNKQKHKPENRPNNKPTNKT